MDQRPSWEANSRSASQKIPEVVSPSPNPQAGGLPIVGYLRLLFRIYWQIPSISGGTLAALPPGKLKPDYVQ
jgi:hypothetical protein